jgi:hypothetical protein
MVATGLGNVLASQFLHRAHAEPGWHLYAPPRALFEADRSSEEPLPAPDGASPRETAGATAAPGPTPAAGQQ